MNDPRTPSPLMERTVRIVSKPEGAGQISATATLFVAGVEQCSETVYGDHNDPWIKALSSFAETLEWLEARERP